MTDYTKLHLVCQDFAVGLQSANTVIDNNQALWERLDKRHAVGIQGNDAFLGPGRHDDVLIARTVADFTVVSGPSGDDLLFSLLSGPLIFEAPIALSTGQWLIYVTTPRPFTAKATIKGASASRARDATCLVRSDPAGPYVVVSTWDVESVALAAYDFSLVLWSQGVA